MGCCWERDSGRTTVNFVNEELIHRGIYSSFDLIYFVMSSHADCEDPELFSYAIIPLNPYIFQLLK